MKNTNQVIGVGIIIVAWVIVAVFSVVQIVYVSNMYTHMFDGGVSRAVASYRMESEVRALRQVLTASVLHAHTTNETGRQNALNSLMAEAQQIRASLFFALDEYEFSVITDPMQTQVWVHSRLEMTRNLRYLVELIFSQFFHVIFNYAFIGDYYEAGNVFAESTAMLFSLMDEVNYLVEISDAAMQHAFFHVHDTVNVTVMTITVISVVAIIGSIIAAVVLLLPKRNSDRIPSDIYVE